MTTVAAALAAARAAGLPRLDSQLLLSNVLGCSRTRLIAGDERELSTAETQAWASQLARRAGGEPLAYVLGEKEFHGLMFEVTPEVLIPRPETELLVDWVAEPQTRAVAARTLLDLGTGSGALAVVLKTRWPSLAVTATDASLAALAVARRNAARHRAEISFRAGSWWQPLAGQRFDIVVANPPYVAGGDPHLDALRHEPQAALSPGGDGLGAIAEIVGAAPQHMAPGGWLFVEHGFDQAASVGALFAAAGFVAATRNDLAGRPRATGGQLR